MKIEIDSICHGLSLEVGHDEMWVSFQFRDIEGTIRNASITPHAVSRLAVATHDLMDSLLVPLIRADAGVKASINYPEAIES